MPLTTNVSGTNRTATAWVNVAGTFRKAALWHNVAGVWKQITSLIAATLQNATYNASRTGAQSVAQVVIDNNGYVYSNNATGTGLLQQYQWVGANPVADYQVRASVLSETGNTVSGTRDTWQSCSVDRGWSIASGTTNPEDSASAQLLIEIGDLAGSVIASATVNLNAYYSSGA